MKRMDDLLEAATSRFRYDAGLRQEIARELRAHLEDSIAAARAEGMDEAQAEEAAVRAFGDPEEIGEKLWQANRRRMRRRAAAMAAVGVVLMPAGILAAVSLVSWFLDENMGPINAIICMLAIATIYLVTRLFLPKTTLFGLAFLRWLPVAFGKSVAIAFRNPWIWAPVFALFASSMAPWLIIQWHQWTSRVSLGHQSFTLLSGGLWYSVHSHLSQVNANVPAAWGLLLNLGYLLFAVRIGKWLQTATGLTPRCAFRWHIAFMVGASANILMWIQMLLIQWPLSKAWSSFLVSHHLHDYTGMLAGCASAPFDALILALFLTMVLRRLRGQPLSPASVLSSAMVSVAPLACVLLIARVGFYASYLVSLLARADGFQSSLGEWIYKCSQQGEHYLNLAMAFLPVIIVSEQCGFWRACVRFGDFVQRFLWRYVAFVFLGALLLSLPWWAIGAVFGPDDVSWSTHLGVTTALYAVGLALQLALAVMCFEFYLTRAGTFEPTEAEEVSSQVPSEGTR